MHFFLQKATLILVQPQIRVVETFRQLVRIACPCSVALQTRTKEGNLRADFFVKHDLNENLISHDLS